MASQVVRSTNWMYRPQTPLGIVGVKWYPPSPSPSDTVVTKKGVVRPVLLLPQGPPRTTAQHVVSRLS